jgi:uncharacterized protein YjiS (DUF1127 family)
MSTLLREHYQPVTTPKLRDGVAAQPATALASARHAPAAAIANRPVEAPPARWRLILRFLFAALREWRHRTVARRELASLDARSLRDIGLEPGDVDYELCQSFWRPLRDLRN